MSRQNYIDAGLHALWALWVAVLVVRGVEVAFLPLLAVGLPRELLQTYNALEDRTLPGLVAHVKAPGYAKEKLVDLAGWLVGGIVAALLVAFGLLAYRI